MLGATRRFVSLNTAPEVVQTDTSTIAPLSSYASEMGFARILSEELFLIRQSLSYRTNKNTAVRGLCRRDAAGYIGVSTTRFDELVKSDQMPSPVRIGGRVVWDIRELDECFDLLKDANQDQANFDEDALLAGWE